MPENYDMPWRRFATFPSAFMTGLVGSVVYAWAEEHRSGLTRGSELAIYVVLVVVPFLVCVIGVDTKRWDANYRFTDAGKADFRRMWLRWGVYITGGLVGRAIA